MSFLFGKGMCASPSGDTGVRLRLRNLTTSAAASSVVERENMSWWAHSLARRVVVHSLWNLRSCSWSRVKCRQRQSGKIREGVTLDYGIIKCAPQFSSRVNADCAHGGGEASVLPI